MATIVLSKSTNIRFKTTDSYKNETRNSLWNLMRNENFVRVNLSWIATIIFIIVIIIFIIIVVVVVKLTHSKTILEITVEIEPPAVPLDFKNLS